MTNLFETERSAFVGFAHVALEQSIDLSNGLVYAIPPALSDLTVGERVVVPLGRANKLTRGFVTALRRECNLAQVKPIEDRDPHALSLSGELIQLAQWMASYYCCPLGMVLATMLPAAVKRGAGRVTQTEVSLSADEDGPAVDNLTKLQRAILQSAQELAAEDRTWVTLRHLADRASARTVGPVKHLISKGLLVSRKRSHVRADLFLSAPATQPPPPLTLSSRQRHAIDRIADSLDSGFEVFLLHGVTGSGKTEVYLRVIEILQERHPDRGAIMLVPEIALTPQTVTRFQQRFRSVAVLHSGLTSGQRNDQWQHIRQGRAGIVVGARSAVFAPLPATGLIIVDEEHESSYKQDQLPRYHARDVAVRRGQILDIPVILGSATPSLESYYNACEPIRIEGSEPEPKVGVRTRYQLLRLPDRVTGLTLPKVQIVDMVEERRHRSGVHLISRRLEDLLHYSLRQKSQVILLLNRRGYANYIACPDHRCGWLMICRYCDTTVVYHQHKSLPSGGYVRCHHCAAEQLLEPFCPACSKKITLFGLGTQRVEEELTRKLPKARLARMDSDTMKDSRDYLSTLDRFGAGDIDILLGTQMIAKGLDYPNVRLVGVISADTSLHFPDFRSAERTFQLIAQVAGRSGRGNEPGIAVVQTFSPNEAVIVMASEHNFESFAAQELEVRRQVGLPPTTRMARIVVRHRELEACRQQARTIWQHLHEHNEQQGQRVDLHEPVPCPIARIAEYHRHQIELIAPDAVTLQRLLTAARNDHMLRSDVHTAIDVDPLVML